MLVHELNTCVCMRRAPLRLRTGVLLYGPPGCGKTHTVAAAVAAAGMRFISVKGPEVLNKYIGASEAAVRTLFRQALASSLCASGDAELCHCTRHRHAASVCLQSEPKL